MRYTNLAAIAVTAIALAAGGADAQTVDRVIEQDTESVRSAIELEKQAGSAIAEARWSEAASMLRDASDLRPSSDPIGLSNLSAAGSLYAATGQLAKARHAFVELSERAAQYGEVDTAAHAFIDAAHVTAELGDSRSAVDYYERARRLAMSSYLSSEEVVTLTARLAQSRTLFAGVGR